MLLAGVTVARGASLTLGIGGMTREALNAQLLEGKFCARIAVHKGRRALIAGAAAPLGARVLRQAPSTTE